MRVLPTVSRANPQWMETNFDELEGASHLSCAELRRRLHETDAIVQSIDGLIRSMVSTAGRNTQSREQEAQNSPVQLPDFRWGGHTKRRWSTSEYDESYSLLDYQDLRFARSGIESFDFGVSCSVIDKLSNGVAKFFASLVRPLPTPTETDESRTVLENDSLTEPVGTGTPEAIEEQEGTGTTDRELRHRSASVDESETSDTETNLTEPNSNRRVVFADLVDDVADLIDDDDGAQNRTRVPPDRQASSLTDYRTIVLTKEDPDSDEDESNMSHWGFELVVWTHESGCLRVGQVQPRSPAFEGDLQEHDIIQSVDGELVSDDVAAFVDRCIRQEESVLTIVVERDPRVQPPRRLPRNPRVERTVTLNDIYEEGPPWTELTIVQTAVIKMALSKNLPALARRLLCPSLSWDEALIVCNRLRGRIADLQSVASITDELWRRIIRLDNERSLSEDGEVVIREGGNEYKIPTARLPLDAIAENFFRARNAVGSSPSPVDVANHPATRIDGNGAADTVEGHRIRGGGEPSHKHGLGILSHSKWMHQAVWGQAVFDGDDLSKFVAFVNEQPDGENAPTAKVNVSVIWIRDFDFENSGPLLPVAYDIEAEIADLFLVVVGSAESAIAEQFLASQEEDGRPQIRYFDPSDLTLLAEKAWEEQARKFVLRQSARVLGQLSLGRLPDGRSLLWLASDCCALFVVGDEQVDTAAGEAHIEKASPCGWGCGRFNDLPNHLRGTHSYFEEDAFFDDIRRTSSKKEITRLLAHLSKRIVTDCPGLWAYVEEVLSNDQTGVNKDGKKLLVLSPTKLLQFDRFQNLQLRPVNMKGANGMKTKEALSLVTKIMLLFKVDGSSRLQNFSYFNCSESSPFQEETKQRASPAQCACFGELCSKVKLSVDCDLCSVFGERTFRCGKHSSAPLDYRSLGCSTVNKKTQSILSDDSTIRTPSMLQRSKSLMLELAKSMPSEIRWTTPLQEMGTSKSMWEEKEFQAWCYFVEQSLGVRQIAQALIVLVSSVNKFKLPAWWRASHGGWSQALVLTRLKSVSSLSLHLYVLDAAIAEAEATRNAGQADAGSHVGYRARRLVEKAVAAGVPVHTDEHSDACIGCQKIGCDLRCKFCSNSQHGSCVEPPITEQSSVEDWVCDACATDITELV
uniref:PHD-type domain-containing protein n=1 Tax=Grammatophora oceanica TaxID=210454 RepID=A0A7S1YFT5_9STRA